MVVKALLGPASARRLLELARAIPDFAQDLEENLRSWGLPMPLAQARAVLDGSSPLLLELRQREEERARQREQLRRECIPEHPTLAVWRARQEARCLSQLGAQRHQVILHYPAAFELTAGCSVGCWFCGLAAPPLSGVFEASEPHLALWQGILTALQEHIGAASRRAFGYWATDPLDHPDYEVFCRHFYRLLGGWPRTTTALAGRQTQRARALLAESHQHGCRTDRLSVLSKGDLRRIYEAFSPDELLDVDLIIHFSGSQLMRSAAGRARHPRRGRAADFPALPEDAGTIACVSGFLVELPARRVRLITPCRATENYPLGYVVVGEARFETAADFAQSLQDLSSPQRLETIPTRDRKLRFRSDLRYFEGDLLSAHRRHRLAVGKWPTSEPLEGPSIEPSAMPALEGESAEALTMLVGRLQGPGVRLGEAAAALRHLYRQPPEVTAARCLSLWNAGLLEEFPEDQEATQSGDAGGR
jgi:radical SAM family RiPP maturation amino acid epimerase